MISAPRIEYLQTTIDFNPGFSPYRLFL